MNFTINGMAVNDEAVTYRLDRGRRPGPDRPHTDGGAHERTEQRPAIPRADRTSSRISSGQGTSSGQIRTPTPPQAGRFSPTWRSWGNGDSEVPVVLPRRRETGGALTAYVIARDRGPRRSWLTC